MRLELTYPEWREKCPVRSPSFWNPRRNFCQLRQLQSPPCPRTVDAKCPLWQWFKVFGAKETT